MDNLARLSSSPTARLVVAAVLGIEAAVYGLVGRSDYLIFYLVRWANYSYDVLERPYGELPKMVAVLACAVLFVVAIGTAAARTWANPAGIIISVMFLVLSVISLPSAYELAMAYHPPPMGSISRFLIIYASGIPLFLFTTTYFWMSRRRSTPRSRGTPVQVAPSRDAVW